MEKMKDTGIDLGYLIFKITSRWYLFIISLFFTVAIAYLYINTADRIYKFKSSVLVGYKRTGSKSSGGVELVDVIKNLDERNITDEIGLIESIDRVTKAVKKLNFGISYYVTDGFKTREKYKKTPYTVILDSAKLQMIGAKMSVQILSAEKYKLTVEGDEVRLYNCKTAEVSEKRLTKVKIAKTRLFGKMYAEDNLPFKIVLNQKPEEIGERSGHYFVIQNINSVGKGYKAAIKLEPTAKEAYMVDISIEGKVPEKQIDFLNELMRVYLEEDLNEKKNEGQKTLDYTNQQLEKARQELAELGGAIEAYRSAKSITNIDNVTAVSSRNLEAIENDLRNAELKQDNYRTMYQLLQENNASTLSPSYFNIGDPTVNYYINNITQKQQQKITELKDVNEDHPKLKALNAEINSYTNGLKGYVKNNIQAADKAVNRSKIDLLQAQRKIATIPKDDRQLRDLELDYNLKKQAYSDLELRKREAEIRRETNRSDHTIIDEAKMDGDKHIAPNAMIIYFMALFFGGIIPLTYIIFMEFLNTTVKGKEDISSVTQVPLLVMLAKGGKKNRNQIIMTTQPKSLLAESFRLLKIKLDHLYEHLPTKIIGITSTVSAEGKTFCACNLSAACAMTGNRTLLICADLYQSDFNYFPIGNVGLSTYLKQQANLTAAIQNTPIEGLDILPTGGVVGNPAELLSSAQMSYLIDEIRTRYEYIIIDTPPIGYVSDYLVLEKYFNASLYMVRYGYTKTKLLRTVQELHQNEKIKNLHIVLNDVKYSSIYELRYKESRKVPAYYRHS